MAALLDIVKKGSTDRSVTVRIVDSTDGTPETGVVFNTSGIDLWYRRMGAAKTSITEATLSALTDAHSDGGFLHIGDGEYRLDLPDAAFATGAQHVDVGGTVTGMVVIGGRVRLVDYDPEDTVRLGLTALPNAAAEAAGGLYTRGTGAGQINQPANGLIDGNVTRFGGTAGTFASGRPEVNTTHVAGTSQTGRDLGASVLLSPGTGTGQISLSSGAVLLQATQTGVTIPTVTTVGTVNALAANSLTAAAAAADFGAELADAVLDEALSGHTTAGTLGHRLQAIRANTAQAGAAGTITLDASASATDDFYNGNLIFITAGTGALQARVISDYVGSTKVATITPNWATNPSSDSVFQILPGGGASVTGTVDANLVTVAGSATGVSALATNITAILEDTGTTLQGELDGIQADTEDIQSRLPAALVSGRMSSDMVAVSGDTTAADNLETAFDDTAGAVRWTRILDQGTAQAATGTTLRLRSAAAFADDELNGSWVVITGGSAGVGQVRRILDYTSSTDTATVATWTTTPTGTITYAVIPGVSDDGSGLTAIPWNSAWDAEVESEALDALNTILADSIPADGTLPTVRQALYMLTQYMFERSVSSTTCTVRKADGSTSLFTLTLNDGTSPTAITRAT